MNHVNVIELLVSRSTKAFINQPNAKKQTAHDMCITDLAREALMNPPGQVSASGCPCKFASASLDKAVSHSQNIAYKARQIAEFCGDV